MSWKPIDTAPRDGTEIVVAYRRPRDGSIVAAVSFFEDGEWCWAQGSEEQEVLTSGDTPFAWIDVPG